MAPAFSSSKQAGAFALSLLVLLLLPIFIGGVISLPRDAAYTSLSYGYGPYHYIRRQIFEETGDLDIAFIGSSRVLYGVDTLYVQKELSEKLGRKANVVTLGFSWAGFDALYAITRDLLKNRRVHLIVFAEEWRGGEGPHHAAPHLFRFVEDRDELTELPFQMRAAYYFSSVIGAPRNLLNLFRADYSTLSPEGIAAWEKKGRAPDPATTLGGAYSSLGFDHLPSKFVDFVPPSEARPADVAIYSSETTSLFQFKGSELPPLQLHFARKFASLAQEQGCTLVCLHLPEFNEIRLPVVQESQDMAAVLRAPISLVGIPPGRMFAGISDDDAQKLFLDTNHFNTNGQRYFTRLITPTLLRLYGKNE